MKIPLLNIQKIEKPRPTMANASTGQSAIPPRVFHHHKVKSHDATIKVPKIKLTQIVGATPNALKLYSQPKPEESTVSLRTRLAQ